MRGQDDRNRERHAMDGVWLPAGGRRPETRGCPGSRHKPGPGIAKGEAFSPLVRPRQRQVGKSPQPTGRNRTNQKSDFNQQRAAVMPSASDHPSRGKRRASPNSARPTAEIHHPNSKPSAGLDSRQTGRGGQAQPVRGQDDRQGEQSEADCPNQNKKKAGYKPNADQLRIH